MELTSVDGVFVKLRWQGHWHSSRMPPGDKARFTWLRSAEKICSLPCIPEVFKDKSSPVQVRSVTCKVKMSNIRKPMNLPIRVIFCLLYMVPIYRFFRSRQQNSFLGQPRGKAVIAMPKHWLKVSSSSFQERSTYQEENEMGFLCPSGLSIKDRRARSYYSVQKVGRLIYTS